VDYLTVKWLHILSSTILFGTGLGSAFYMFMANRKKQVADIHFTARHVVLADWIFTTPAVIFQLLSGLYLVYLTGHRLSEGWIAGALGLYVFVGVCWVPVVWIQIKMRDMAKEAVAMSANLPERYWIYHRWWIVLGALAFPSVIVIFWLMVVKPT
jgi:uncharacterized membrane protein